MRSPAQRPEFDEPRYFDYLSGLKRWNCNACTSSPVVLAEHSSMTVHAALKHEKTREHKENVRAREEWNAPPDTDAWIKSGAEGLFENRVTGRIQHVDQLKEFIPFWRRTIEAAEYGETLRFEDFLNTLQNKEEEAVAWNVALPDWAVEPLEPVDAVQRSAATGRDHRSESSHGLKLDCDAVDFVEKVARMDSLNAERKERLRAFYKIPTNEKVKRIYELINALRVARGTS